MAVVAVEELRATPAPGWEDALEVDLSSESGDICVNESSAQEIMTSTNSLNPRTTKAVAVGRPGCEAYAQARDSQKVLTRE